MEKIYYLDLQTLLEYLQGQSALLATEVTIPGQRAACKGYLFFQNYSIIGCLIQAPDGSASLREGEEAYRLLRANEQWQVRIDPNIEQTFWSIKQQGGSMRQVGGPRQAPSLPPAKPARVPRLIRPLDPALLSQFPAKQALILRMVYTLVNGQRAVDQIKAQLHLSAEVIEEALSRLRALGVIE